METTIYKGEKYKIIHRYLNQVELTNHKGVMVVWERKNGRFQKLKHFTDIYAALFWNKTENWGKPLLP